MAGGKSNLQPVRTKEEARERGRRGGIASGESRREKRTLRQCLEILLESPAPEGHDGDNREAMSAALIKRALTGDVAAFSTIRDTVGEKPTDKLAGPDGGPLELSHGLSPALSAALAQIKGGGADV